MVPESDAAEAAATVSDPQALTGAARTIEFTRRGHLGMTADPAEPGDVMRLPAAIAGDFVQGNKARFCDLGPKENQREPDRDLVLAIDDRREREAARLERRRGDLDRIAGVVAPVAVRQSRGRRGETGAAASE